MDKLALKPVDQLTENEAEWELAALAEECAHHAEQYYKHDNPEISDADYDALKRRNMEIEERFPHLIVHNSPSLWAFEPEIWAPSDLPSESDFAPAAAEEAAVTYPIETGVPLLERRVIRPRRWSPVEAVTIENFKAIDQTKVGLGAVTILVGPNGSGKSSVLQAIHWAARCASYIAPKNGKEMIAFERIDYLPSHEPLKTAFRGELKSDTKTRPTRVSFQHEAAVEEAQAPVAVVKLWAARNNGGISAHIEGGGAVSPYKQRTSFVTAYIPGLAGLAERESILAQPTLRRQAASGDAGGVLRNILLGLSTTRIVDDVDGLIDGLAADSDAVIYLVQLAKGGIAAFLRRKLRDRLPYLPEMTRHATLAVGDDPFLVPLELIHHDARHDQLKSSVLVQRGDGLKDWELAVVFRQVEPDTGINQQV